MTNLSNLRQRFIDYHTNTHKYADLENAQQYDEGRVIVRLQPLESVLQIEEIGSGAFGTVYSIPSNSRMVMKVVKRRGDRAYEAFIDHCRANAGDPHLPIIHYSGNWSGRQVILLERLQPLNETEERWAINMCSKMRTRDPLKEDSENRMVPQTNTPQSLIDTFRGLRNLKNAHGLCWDLHGGNFMYREKDRQLVVTDPFTA